MVKLFFYIQIYTILNHCLSPETSFQNHRLFFQNVLDAHQAHTILNESKIIRLESYHIEMLLKHLDLLIQKSHLINFLEIPDYWNYKLIQKIRIQLRFVFESIKDQEIEFYMTHMNEDVLVQRRVVLGKVQIVFNQNLFKNRQLFRLLNNEDYEELMALMLHILFEMNPSEDLPDDIPLIQISHIECILTLESWIRAVQSRFKELIPIRVQKLLKKLFHQKNHGIEKAFLFWQTLLREYSFEGMLILPVERERLKSFWIEIQHYMENIDNEHRQAVSVFRSIFDEYYMSKAEFRQLYDDLDEIFHLLYPVYFNRIESGYDANNIAQYAQSFVIVWYELLDRLIQKINIKTRNSFYHFLLQEELETYWDQLETEMQFDIHYVSKWMTDKSLALNRPEMNRLDIEKIMKQLVQYELRQWREKKTVFEIDKYRKKTLHRLETLKRLTQVFEKLLGVSIITIDQALMPFFKLTLSSGSFAYRYRSKDIMRERNLRVIQSFLNSNSPIWIQIDFANGSSKTGFLKSITGEDSLRKVWLQSGEEYPIYQIKQIFILQDDISSFQEVVAMSA